MMRYVHSSPTWRLSALGLLAMGMLVLGGCYEDIGMTRYEPGVYKGSDDPLTAKLQSGELQQQLTERFDIAARDR